MKQSFPHSQRAALSILFLSLNGGIATAEPREGNPGQPATTVSCRWGSIATKGQQIAAAAEGRAVSQDLVNAEVDRLGGFINEYQMAVASGDPLASQKLSEAIQVATGVDPTAIASEFMDAHLSSIRQHGDAAKGIANGLAGLTADLKGLQTGEETQAEDKANIVVRRGKELMRSWGLMKVVDRAIAMESTGTESMATISERVRALRDSGVKQRERILNDNSQFLAKAQDARAKGLFFQAVGLKANEEMQSLEPGSPVHLAAEVSRDSYLRSAEAHLENEQLFRKAIKTNALVLEQINSGLQTMTTKTNVQLSALATSLVTAQSAQVAKDLITVNELVDTTAANAELKVAKAISDLSETGKKAGERTRLTRDKVAQMIEQASLTTTATEQARKEAVMGNIARLTLENNTLAASNIAAQTRLGFVQPGLAIGVPQQAGLLPARNIKPLEDGQ